MECPIDCLNDENLGDMTIDHSNKCSLFYSMIGLLMKFDRDGNYLLLERTWYVDFDKNGQIARVIERSYMHVLHFPLI